MFLYGSHYGGTVGGAELFDCCIGLSLKAGAGQLVEQIVDRVPAPEMVEHKTSRMASHPFLEATVVIGVPLPPEGFAY